MNSDMISPCGLNCNACIAHLRKKNVCFGCNIEGGYTSKTMTGCIIKNCETRQTLGLLQCGSICPDFPCKRLSGLSKRYRERYDVDLLDNLRRIETEGLEQFAAEDDAQWICPVCGERLSMHRSACLHCSALYRDAAN